MQAIHCFQSHEISLTAVRTLAVRSMVNVNTSDARVAKLICDNGERKIIFHFVLIYL